MWQTIETRAYLLVQSNGNVALSYLVDEAKRLMLVNDNSEWRRTGNNRSRQCVKDTRVKVLVYLEK